MWKCKPLIHHRLITKNNKTLIEVTKLVIATRKKVNFDFDYLHQTSDKTKRFTCNLIRNGSSQFLLTQLLGST